MPSFGPVQPLGQQFEKVKIFSNLALNGSWAVTVISLSSMINGWIRVLLEV